MNAHCLVLEKTVIPVFTITTELFKVQLRVERRQILVKGLGAVGGLGWDFWRGFLFAFTAEQRGIFFFQAHKNKEKRICLFSVIVDIFYSPRKSVMETGEV